MVAIRSLLVSLALVGMVRAENELGSPAQWSFPLTSEPYTMRIAFGSDSLTQVSAQSGDGIYFFPGDVGYANFVSHLTDASVDDFILELNGSQQVLSETVLGAPFTGKVVTEIELGSGAFTDRVYVGMVVRGSNVPEPSSILMVLGLLVAGMFRRVR